jgi:hypothetical protein
MSEDEMGRTSSMHEVRNAYSFGWKSEGSRSLEGRGCGWEDNIKMDIGKTEGELSEWVHLAWDWVQWRDLVDTVMTFRVP